MNSHPRTNEAEPPPYEVLAAEEAHLPNSRYGLLGSDFYMTKLNYDRFGRWRSWIEKRARERYESAPDSPYDQQLQPGWNNPGSQVGWLDLNGSRILNACV
jgi:hypothetical protein